MANIISNDLGRFLSKELNLSYNLVTTSLDTINRFNLIERFSRSEELNSQKICEKLEGAISNLNRPLKTEEKRIALINLEAMNKKFSKSADTERAGQCTAIISRIIKKINEPVQSSSTNGSSPLRNSAESTKSNQSVGSTVSNSPRKGHKKSKHVTPPVSPQTHVSTSSPLTDKKTQRPGSTVVQQTVVQQSPPVVHRALTGVAHGPQKAIVDAISLSTKKVETTTETVQKFVPNMDRINEIEKGITDEDRRVYLFKRHLVYYRHEDKYYFNALKLNIQNGMRFCTQTLVEAKDVKEHMAKVKVSGANDVGALLRQRMQQMGIGFQERNQ